MAGSGSHAVAVQLAQRFAVHDELAVIHLVLDASELGFGSAHWQHWLEGFAQC